ncbi:MAG TPA: putative Ig domain-containing protein [Oligoflexus sp.]|uniref:putative Ig domain-containing protein n=1 Tax=Oligoflexus sp. TaxID=1971216 RepID=UPI002D2EFEA2|nr:putative Ig domain-containing protein [Oligoflexus sp.]HYX33277.1 putative Ig domain-containing protein [Oligoflexus sp.]
MALVQTLQIREVTFNISEDSSAISPLPWRITPLTIGGTPNLASSMTMRKKPEHGALLFRGLGWEYGSTNDYAYFPTRNFFGKDTFQFEYTDPADLTRLYRVVVTVNIASVNDQPFVWAPSKIYAQPGRETVGNIFASDEDFSNLAITAAGLPVGAIFDAPTRTLRWTPASKDVGIYSVRFSATDGISTVTRDMTIDVVAQNSPRKVWYDGTTYPFVEGIGWDTAASTVKEGLAGTNKFIEYTINNRNYWGAAAYSFGSNTQTNLSAYSYLRFEMWSSSNVTAMVSLVDYFTGKESIRKSFALTTKAIPVELNLNELAANGFDISKTTSIVIATSVGTTTTFKIGVDNLITEGVQPVVLPQITEPYVVLEHDAESKGVRARVLNLPNKVITAVSWNWFTSTFIGFRNTTGPVLSYNDVKECYSCRNVWADVTIDGVVHRAINTIGLPYVPNNPPPALNYNDYIDMADTHIMGDPIFGNRAYELAKNKSMALKNGNGTGTESGYNLVTVKDGLRWSRGVVPYTLSGLDTSETNILKNMMKEIFDRTGIVFIENTFVPLDPGSLDNTIPIRHVTKDDMTGATDAQKIAKLGYFTCASFGLGKGAKLLLLNRAPDVGCLPVLGELRHELYHVLGAAHEQKSALQDPTAIKLDHVYPWDEDQFVNNDALISHKFDPASIMMYGRVANSVCIPTGVDAALQPVWFYPEPALNAELQARLNRITPDICRRNAAFDKNLTCIEACATNTLAPVSEATAYSPDDVLLMKNFYRLNSAFRTQVDALSATEKALVTPAFGAKVLGGINYFLKQGSVDQAVANSLEYRLISKTLAALRRSPVTIAESCHTAPTDIINGRKSCSRGPTCVSVSGENKVFLAGPDFEKKTSFQLGETACSGAYSDGGRKFCMQVNARGGTANGSSGFISCKYSLTETEI